jgi:hypothetical protein
LETGGKAPVSGANELRRVVTTATTEPAKKSWFAILVTSAAVIAVAVGGYLSYEKFSAEKAEPERLRSEAAMAKSAVAAAKAAAEKGTAERAATEKAAAERAAAEKPDAEKAAAEKADAEKAAAERATAKKVAAEKAAAEKADAEKAAAERAAAKKTAAERALAESQVRIPLVIGTNVDWAKPFLERHGLTVKVVGGSSGKVIQQAPGFGASVPQGSTVELTIRP